jgi:hypothetical protein
VIRLLFAMVAIAATEAQANDLRSCQDAGVGIEALVTPVAKNAQSPDRPR